MRTVSLSGRRAALTLFALIVVFGAAVCFAQIVDSGRISGTVQDSSGGVIANAGVLLQNDATGLTDKAVTNGEGLFVSQPLPPAEYSVVVAQSGFARVVQHVHLEVGQRASITLVLTPGKASETVNVEANAPLLGTETSTLSNLRTETAVQNLPLDGRNFAELVDLSAGVVPAQSQAPSVALSAVRGETSYSVNGLRPEENNYLLDGISDSENHNGLGIVLFPPLDAVEEFREETSVADARYGRGGGGTINLVFKSGTDQFHGDLFEFLRNSDLDAKNFFDKQKPPFKMNQFGGTFGGPLLGRHNPKTFFFVDYQGTRMDQGLTYISTVPTAAERQGNFSALPQQIYNPLTTVQAPNGTYSRAPFAGNIIPSGLISQVGQNLINLYPLPNLPGFANNYLYQPTRTLDEDEVDGRVDHRFSDKDGSFLRYSHARDNIFQPGPLPAPAVGGAISGLSREPSDQAVLTENHIFSATAINTARVGWSRVDIDSTDANAGQTLATQVGIPGSNVPGNPLTDGLPMIPVTGAATLGSYGNLPATIVSNNYQVDDSVSLIRGRHTFTFGVESQRRQYNLFQTANLRGTMSFTTAYSSDPAIATGTGLGLADLLLGTPISGSLQYLDGTRGLRQTELAGYAQDDFKVTAKLTLNIGVRYENYLGWPWTEVGNRAYNFVPANGGTVAQVGTDGIPSSGVYDNKLDFMPRVGFAYQVLPKTVFRVAYGIFYSAPQTAFASGITANPPELISTAFVNNQYNFTGAQPASAGFSHPAVGTVLGSALYYIDPHSKLPYTQQWNSTIQHQLTSSTLLTVAYVGTVGTHLQAQDNINQPVPGTTPIAQRRPFPLYQTITSIEDVDKSNYQALQVTAERRFAKNLSFNLAYTYSHALDSASLNPSSGGALFMDSYDHQLDYGNADYNIPNRFVGSATYALPFRASGLARYLVQGWQLNGILSLYGGIPFSVQSATNTLNTGGTSRAELIGPGNGSLPASQRTTQEWFDVAAFSGPPLLQYGDVGRNTLYGPGTKQLDFSTFKSFAFNEGKQSLQFRAEAFNLLNTPQLNNPSATIGAAGAGTIISAGSPFTFQRLSREVQFALKLYF
ncbi:MAG: carboxypeptidase regulatory-like domain-containing protein [Bryobacteraceae bacterium]|jgi:hypothetical protein